MMTNTPPTMARYEALTDTAEVFSFRRFDGSFVTFVVTARTQGGAFGFYMRPNNRRSGDVFLPGWRLAEAV